MAYPSEQWVCEICDKGEEECRCDEYAGLCDAPWICEICELTEAECHCDDYFEPSYEDPIPYPDLATLSISRKICAYFRDGTCKYGDGCRDLHDTTGQFISQNNGTNFRENNYSQQPKVCQFYQQGNCKYGSNCYDAHTENDVTKKKRALLALEAEIKQLKIEIKEKQKELDTLKKEVVDE